MGKSLADSFPEAARVFQETDGALGFPLSRLCFEGPDDQVAQEAWVTDVAAELEQDDHGAYVNFIGDEGRTASGGALCQKVRRHIGHTS